MTTMLRVAVTALGAWATTTGCPAQDPWEAPPDAPASDTGAAPDAPPEPDATPDADAPPEPDAGAAPHALPIGPEDPTFHVGPYIMHTTQTTVVVAWETVDAGDSVIEYAPDDADDPFAPRAEGEAGTMHTVTLEDLAPGAIYAYRACTGARCTGELGFATAPAPGQPFRLAIYGDSRSDPPQHRAVAESMIASAPTIVFHSGDIVEDGGHRDEFKAMHFDPTRHLGHYVPIYVAIGNHEWKEQTTEVQNFRDYVVFPRDPGVPLPELSYAVTYGDVFVIVLDNTVDSYHLFFPLEGMEDPPLWTWLVEQARSPAAAAATWRFAVFHYPPRSPCHEDWINFTMTREFVVPLLRDAGFHAIFAGHVHDYERHDFDGLPVFVTGGGGAGLEDISACAYPDDELVTMRSVHHHLTVDVARDRALVEAVDLDGEVFDSLELAP